MMKTLTIPVGFVFAHMLTVGRPMVPLDVAAFFLNRPPKQVLKDVHAGRLGYAWDISSPGCERKAEVRIYWRCLLAAVTESPIQFKEEEVYEDIVPQSWKQVRATVLQQRWGCSQWLLAKLMETHCLAALAGGSRGPASSPEVLRTSVIEFLKSRRMTGMKGGAEPVRRRRRKQDKDLQ